MLPPGGGGTGQQNEPPLLHWAGRNPSTPVLPTECAHHSPGSQDLVTNRVGDAAGMGGGGMGSGLPQPLLATLLGVDLGKCAGMTQDEEARLSWGGLESAQQ